MISHSRHSTKVSVSGFTIVELLIVVVVIAILAAIALLSYNGVVDSATKSTMQGDLHTASTKVELFKASTGVGSYPDSLDQAGFSANSGSQLTFQYSRTTAPESYCVTVTSNRANLPAYYISSEQTSPTEGTCPGHSATTASIGWKSIDTGYRGTCGLHNDGKTYCWGYGSFNVLGSDDTALSTKLSALSPQLDPWGVYAAVPINFPVSVNTTGSGPFSAIYAPDTISSGGTYCGVNATGQLYCWGNTLAVSSGSGFSELPYLTDTAAINGKQIRHMSIGHSTSACAVDTDGKVYCWGTGYIGDGTSTVSSEPRQAIGVLLGKNIQKVEIANGSSSTTTICALDSDGIVYCWGNGFTGDNQGTYAARGNLPFEVINSNLNSGENFINIAGTGANILCGVTNQGRVLCWGSDSRFDISGELIPTPISRGSIVGKTIIDIDGGNATLCMLDQEHNAHCWGDNSFGGVGDNSTTNRPDPVAVSGGLKFSSIDVGYASTCGITLSKDAYCWGWGSIGTLGNGNLSEIGSSGSPSLSNSSVPVKVGDRVDLEW